MPAGAAHTDAPDWRPRPCTSDPAPRRRLLVSWFGVVLLASACGGGGSDEGDGATPPLPAVPPPSPTPTPAPTPGPTAAPAPAPTPLPTPAPASWQPGPRLLSARDQFAGGVVGTAIFVFGGNRHPDGLNLKSTEMLNTVAPGSTWSYRADNNNFGGHGVEELTGAALHGRFYVFGGLGGNPFGHVDVAEEYDPAAGTWRSRAPLPTPRTAAVAAVHDGRIYVFGGGNGDAATGMRTQRDEVEAFDPLTNTWELVTRMPHVYMGSAVAVVDGKAYVISGGDLALGAMVGDVAVFDFVRGQWTTSGRTPLPRPRAFTYGHAAPVIDGKIYLIGGVEGTVSNLIASDKVDVYDPAADTWAIGPTLPIQTVQSVNVAVGRRLFVVGGNRGSVIDGKEITAATWTLDL